MVFVRMQNFSWFFVDFRTMLMLWLLYQQCDQAPVNLPLEYFHGHIDDAHFRQRRDSDPRPARRSNPTLGRFFEGDMVVTFDPNANANMNTDGTVLNDVAQSAMKDRSKRWPNGVVPYMWSSDFSTDQRDALSRAMRDFHNRTCIRWIPRNGHQDYVYITTHPSQCHASVGRITGNQTLGLAPGCFEHGTIIHEMMHTIGFWHEQSRTDRDDYIEIAYENIEADMQHNFQKYETSYIDSLGQTYDYDSVMHYPPDAFSKDFVSVTIIAKQDGADQMGQRIGFSVKDVRKINLLYECPNVITTTPSPIVLPRVECNSQLTVDSTNSPLTLTSPGYPENYASYLGCMYRISATGSDTIKIYIADFLTEATYDVFEMFNGASIYAPMLERLSGSASSGNTYWTTQNSATIKFTTDSTVSKRGWKIMVYSVTALPSPATYCETTYTRLNSLDEVATVTSRNYPDNYDANQECSAYYETLSHYRLRVRFLDFQTEQNYDFVEFYDGPLFSPHSVTKLSGIASDNSELPDMIITAANVLVIKFKTDGSTQYAGFKLTIDAFA